MKDNPIIVGIALGMALFLFAPIAALIAFPREYILPTFIEIGIDILLLLLPSRFFRKSSVDSFPCSKRVH